MPEKIKTPRFPFKRQRNRFEDVAAESKQKNVCDPEIRSQRGAM
jgi:hypothetical protein